MLALASLVLSAALSLFVPIEDLHSHIGQTVTTEGYVIQYVVFNPGQPDERAYAMLTTPQNPPPQTPYCLMRLDFAPPWPPVGYHLRAAGMVNYQSALGTTLEPVNWWEYVP